MFHSLILYRLCTSSCIHSEILPILTRHFTIMEALVDRCMFAVMITITKSYTFGGKLMTFVLLINLLNVNTLNGCISIILSVYVYLNYI